MTIDSLTYEEARSYWGHTDTGGGQAALIWITQNHHFLCTNSDGMVPSEGDDELTIGLYIGTEVGGEEPIASSNHSSLEEATRAALNHECPECGHLLPLPDEQVFCSYDCGKADPTS